MAYDVPWHHMPIISAESYSPAAAVVMAKIVAAVWKSDTLTFMKIICFIKTNSRELHNQGK